MLSVHPPFHCHYFRRRSYPDSTGMDPLLSFSLFVTAPISVISLNHLSFCNAILSALHILGLSHFVYLSFTPTLNTSSSVPRPRTPEYPAKRPRMEDNETPQTHPNASRAASLRRKLDGCFNSFRRGDLVTDLEVELLTRSIHARPRHVHIPSARILQR